MPVVNSHVVRRWMKSRLKSNFAAAKPIFENRVVQFVVWKVLLSIDTVFPALWPFVYHSARSLVGPVAVWCRGMLSSKQRVARQAQAARWRLARWSPPTHRGHHSKSERDKMSMESPKRDQMLLREKLSPRCSLWARWGRRNLTAE